MNRGRVYCHRLTIDCQDNGRAESFSVTPPREAPFFWSPLFLGFRHAYLSTAIVRWSRTADPRL